MRELLKIKARERATRRAQRVEQLEAERAQRQSELFARFPRLAEIQQAQADTALQVGRLVLRLPTRDDLDLEGLRARHAALEAEKQQILAAAGVDAAHLDIWWDCPACRNTGWITPDLAAIAADQVAPARKCACLLQEEIEELYSISGLTGPMREQRFERFDLQLRPPEHRAQAAQVVAACRRFAAQVAANQAVENLVLMGDVGVGKTFLLSAIAAEVLAARRTVAYFTLLEFVDLIRRQKFERIEEEEVAPGLQRLLEADLLLLDDLGAERVSEFVIQELFAVLNHRLNRALPVVISTNLSPKDLREVYTKRVASRILGNAEVLRLRGDDVRLVRKFGAKWAPADSAKGEPPAGVE